MTNSSTINSRSINEGDYIIALVDNPGQTNANWALISSQTSYVAEDLANKNVANGYAGLDNNSKLAISQMPINGLSYKGIWNASTNTPTLPTATPLSGDYFKVSVAGTTNVGGINNWGLGDWVIFNGTNWDKIDNSDLVSSVNGKVGAVTLNAADVGLGNVNNLAISTLDSLTDVAISNPNTNQVLQYNGSNWVNNAITTTSNLDSLTDVAITNPSANQVLQYNGTNWLNNNLGSGSAILKNTNDYMPIPTSFYRDNCPSGTYINLYLPSELMNLYGITQPDPTTLSFTTRRWPRKLSMFCWAKHQIVSFGLRLILDGNEILSSSTAGTYHTTIALFDYDIPGDTNYYDTGAYSITTEIKTHTIRVQTMNTASIYIFTTELKLV